MLEVKVRQVPGTLNNEIFLFNLHSMPGMSVYYTLEHDKQFTAHHFTRNEGAEAVPIEPFMILPDMETGYIIAAFANYAEEHKIDYAGRGVDKGKVIAQQEHIRDLRKLLKIDKDAA